MKIRKDFEIAMKVLNYLKGKYTPVRAEDMAVELGVSFNFLEQVLRKLRVAGFTTVQRGPGGGTTLSSKCPNAFDVAKAIGAYKEPKASVDPTSPQARLLVAVREAYMKTSI